MDQYMETKLDNLYYRTSAKPHLCADYKNATNYNSCTFAQGHSTNAPSRTNFTREDVKNKSSSMASASDTAKFKQLLEYPKSLKDTLGSNEVDQINFIKKFPDLIPVLKPFYPLLLNKIEGYEDPKLFGIF